MPSLSEKLTMYIGKADAKPSTVARYMGISTTKLQSLLNGNAIEIPDDGLDRLAGETGIDKEIWLNESRALPETMPNLVRRGRKAREETPDFLRQQSLRRKRLQEVISSFGSKEEFAKAIGQSPSAISHYLNSRTITDSFLLTVASRANVSSKWLLEGQGDMYSVQALEPLTQHEGELLGRYLEAKNMNNRSLGLLMGYNEASASGSVIQFRKSQQLKPHIKERILTALQATEDDVFPRSIQPTSINDNSLYPSTIPGVPARLIREVGNFSGEPIAVLPFVPVRARAGMATQQYWEQPLLTMRIMQATLAEYEPDPVNPRRSWWVIEIDGDSMEPQLRSRARVLGYYIGGKDKTGMYRLDRSQLNHLKPGIWAIQYNDEFVIKRIRTNHLEADGGLLCHSDNPPPDPFFIRGEAIRHVWFIETVVNSPVR